MALYKLRWCETDMSQCEVVIDAIDEKHAKELWKLYSYDVYSKELFDTTRDHISDLDITITK